MQDDKRHPMFATEAELTFECGPKSETWTTVTALPACYPHHVMITFHRRSADVRRTRSGAWVLQGRRYRTYALAEASRFRGYVWRRLSC